MEATPKRDNMGRLRPGTLISYGYIGNVLTVLGQCFDVAMQERPPLLDLNPATGIRLPKQDRREMFFLDNAAAYAALRCAMHAHFRPLLDFLVGTGARYGEAARPARAPPASGRRPSLRRHPAGAEVARQEVDARPAEDAVLDPPHPAAGQAGAGAASTGRGQGAGGLRVQHGRGQARRPAAPRQLPQAVLEGGRGRRRRRRAEGHPYPRPAAHPLLCAGEAPVVVAKRLGHSSTTTTQDIYGHITTESDDRAITIVDGLLPDVLARDEQGATVVTLSPAEEQMPEFDIDDADDLAA
jgi:hypothetical protein